MKIQSKFKDYYDYISHRFGADPNVFFDRRSTLPERVALPERRGWNDHSFEKFSADFYLAVNSWDTGWRLAHVVAGSIVATTIERSWWDGRRQRELPEELLDIAKHAEALRDDDCFASRRRPSPKRGQQEHDPSEVECLIRAVGAPVFRVLDIVSDRDGRAAVIDSRAPVLKDIVGWMARFPAEQVWQSIYTALASVLRADPDKAPPVEVAERHRIEYAGFDLKTSFRHPVNSPAAAAKRKRSK